MVGTFTCGQAGTMFHLLLVLGQDIRKTVLLTWGYQPFSQFTGNRMKNSIQICWERVKMEVSLCWQNMYKASLEGWYKETKLGFILDSSNSHL